MTLQCCGHSEERHIHQGLGEKASHICLTGFCRCGWPKALAAKVKSGGRPSGQTFQQAAASAAAKVRAKNVVLY